VCAGLCHDHDSAHQESTTRLSILGYEHDTSESLIRLWNDVRPGFDP
jgi:hypothetical protein